LNNDDAQFWPGARRYRRRPRGTADSVERLMGTKAEARFAFISDKAEFASDDLLDV